MLKNALIRIVLLAGVAAQATELDFADGTMGGWTTEEPQVWQIEPMEGAFDGPAVTSRGQGEAGTGTLRSPVFKITSARQVFYIAGADGTAEGTNDGNSNFLNLKDAETDEILRSMRPPGIHLYSEKNWDTADLIGREVYLA